jgi:hypothetical protein
MAYVPIRSYDNYINANLELGLLKDSDINAYIQDEHTITIDPLLSPALGGMKLMVAEADVPKALKLLEATNALFLETIPCPSCNNNTLQKLVNRKSYDTLGGKLWSMLVNGQTVKESTYYRCYTCGETFEEIPE